MRKRTILLTVLLVAALAAATMARPPYTRSRITYVCAAETDTIITFAKTPDATQISAVAGDIWVSVWPGASFFKIAEDRSFTLPVICDSIEVYRSTGTSTETTISAFWE